MYFLETSTLINSCHPHEDNYADLEKLTYSSKKWVTSKTALDELQEVKQKRKMIYEEILEMKKSFAPIEARRLRTKILAKSINDNDKRHLGELFDSCIRDVGLNLDSEVDSSQYSNVLMYSLRNSMIAVLGNMNNILEDIEPHQKCDYQSFREVQKLRKIIMTNIENANLHKRDMVISCDAIHYSYEKTQNITFLSGDTYQLDKQQEILLLAQRVYNKDLSSQISGMYSSDYEYSPTD